MKAGKAQCVQNGKFQMGNAKMANLCLSRKEQQNASAPQSSEPTQELAVVSPCRGVFLFTFCFQLLPLPYLIPCSDMRLIS